jgi:hypothetical protein
MNARRLILAVLAVAFGVLASTSTVAFAAAPETPEVTVESITAAAVTLHGVLNPKAIGPVEEGTYQFVYRPSSKDECKGTGEVLAPVSPGLALGLEPEQVFENVEGLTAGTEYAVCLVEKNLKGEPAVSAAVSFTTAIPPETPEKLEAKPVAATTATLNGVLNPGKAGDAGAYEFFYRQSSSECEGEKQVTTPRTDETGAKEEPATANIEGLLPGTQYTFCLRAHNEAGEEATSAPVTFTTPAAAPRIEESFVSNVASTSATFNAKVNPEAAETTYAFEYAPAGGAFAPVAEAEGSGSVPAGVFGVPVSVHVDGLQPGAGYEFRVVVGNAVERAIVGEVVSLTTERTGEFVLPDGRQWEMVTPPQKEGSLFEGSLGPEAGGTSSGRLEEPDSEVVVQASVAGDGIVDEADQPIEAEPQDDANGVSVLSTRGPAGWASRDLPATHLEATNPSLGFGSEYRFFSEDLSRGALQQFGNFTPLAPEAVESTPYLHTNFLNGDVEERCERLDLSAGSCFQPLVTRGDTQPGVAFGDVVNDECTFFDCGPHLVAGTPDLSHVIVASRVRLTSTPITVPFEAAGYFEKPALYEWFGGQLRLINILPGAEEGNGELQLAAGNKRHVISDNGERVILENEGEHERIGAGGGLYLRDVAKGETISLNVPEPGCGACGGGGEGVQYMTANDEGSRIFFLDTSKLTSDSDGGSDDLYECEVVEVEGKLRCDLSDLTPEAGEAANVATVLGASEDGSYVYFVAGGALAPGATDDHVCYDKVSANGPCNLFVRHDGTTTFIAELSSADSDFYQFFRRFGYLGEGYRSVRARVSPDGRWLSFMSDQDLTGYDTRDAATGEPDEEVYLYDASANTLACASCDPTGARPVGLTTLEGELDHYRVASIVPGWDGFEDALISGIDQIYQPRYLSDSGRLFFDSADALVPRDVNGAVDVYEYEPEGVPAGEHACSGAVQSGSEVFKPARGFEVDGRGGEEGSGCVALISSGTSPEESSFLDASETGGDVFFLTTARLALQDFDDARDIYDAHECVSASPCPVVRGVQPPPCDTEGSCRGAPLPQPAVYGAPSSATFTGAGNLTPVVPSLVAPKQVVKRARKCGQGFVRKRGRCVRSKARRGRAKKAGSARDDRRGE